MENHQENDKGITEAFRLFSRLSLIFILSTALLFLGYLSYEMTHQPTNPALVKIKSKSYSGGGNYSGNNNQADYSKLWQAPDIKALAQEGEENELIRYGRELIKNTAEYLGPKGKVMQIANGLNCQNCHLEAGTAPFAINFSPLAANYPKLRARSGKVEDLHHRVNECFERSMNGSPPPAQSREIKAILAYIKWLGKDVPKGQNPEGSGFVPLKHLGRAAESSKGKPIYEAQCSRCHGNQGEGKKFTHGRSYEYPPLWGSDSYNTAAGIYRVERMAKFIKANMPYGVSHKAMTISDEQAWDLAAYINSQPHPHKVFTQDWPNILDKAPDEPFGPYADSYSEQQHKYGPFPPIVEEIKKLRSVNP